MRGNVVDMAVGIIIGAAFGAIVKSLVDDVLMPPIGLLLGNIHTYDVITLIAVWTTFLLVRTVVERRLNAAAWLRAVTAGALAAISSGYMAYLVKTEEVFAQRVAVPTPTPVGPCTGSTAEIATFPALLDAVYRQIDYAVECIIAEANTTDPIHAEVAPLPFESLLVPSCIESARNVTAGGARYDFTGPVGVGSATVGDSLAAIKRFVLEEKAISLADLGQMLDADFAGDEVWRRWSRFSIWRHRGFLTDRADGSERVCGGRGRCGSCSVTATTEPGWEATPSR